MTKEQYHHGALKKDLIKKGLQLLNKEGYEGFSLRKVAILCGVSHAAPYKHFKNKDELISAITFEAINRFTASLESAIKMHPNNPSIQLVEMGKQYVKFMVENPDYLKFIFLSGNDWPIKIINDTFCYIENSPFLVFKKCSENYLNHVNAPTESRVVDILAMWSLVHGLAVLIVNKSIIYDGDYLNLVATIIIDKLNIKM